MKLLASALAVLLVLALLPKSAAAQEEAAASLLIEARTGTILSEENADTPLPVGSLAKLMTAFLTASAIERGDLSTDTVLTAGNNVSAVKGAVIWLEPGDTITVGELLIGLIAGNANDAAAVLAQAVSGSEEAFVMDMNAAAFDLGMRSTRFTSPQGYDDPESFSTAADLGILACAVLEYDVLKPCLTTWRTFLREETVEIVNENTLTRTLDGCLGMKAAHSEAAGQCLIAACERDGMVCAAVVLGCADEDVRFSIANALLNKGFRNYRVTLPGFAEEFLMPLKVKGGTESAVLLELAALPELAVPGSAEDLQTVMVLPDYVQAPLIRGQPVGTVYFYSGDTLLCSAALLAADDVPEITAAFAFRKALRFLLT